MKKIGFIGAGNMATAIIGSLMGQNDGRYGAGTGKDLSVSF